MGTSPWVSRFGLSGRCLDGSGLAVSGQHR